MKSLLATTAQLLTFRLSREAVLKLASVFQAHSGRKTRMAAQLFHDVADDYQAKFMDVSAYHASFDLFCQNIEKPGAEILDIACGPGNISRYLLEKRPDFKVLGIDLAENMVKLARQNCPQAEFRILDCREIRRLGRRFDGAMCGFCLPYLSKKEAVKLVSDVAAVLLPGAVFCLSTMEGGYEMSGLKKSSDGRHELFQFFHQADYLTAALTENGFEILDLRRLDNGSPQPDLVIVSNKIKNRLLK